MEMSGIHGGDVYRNDVKMDFSVNVNPLGMPKAVEAALYKAVGNCSQYPDWSAEKLRCAVSEMLDVPGDNLIFGNGASELFMAIVHAIKPRKSVIPVPSFYGYEYAAGCDGGETIYCEMKKENNFSPQEDFLDLLTEDVDILFLANPNNPTGNLIRRDFLQRVVSHCRDKGIYVVLDECFIEFCGQEYSMLQDINMFPNLIIVRAFTKIFSIPGVRLGYLISSNKEMSDKIKRQLPEWNVSVLAQAAGCECARQTALLGQTVTYVERERQFLENGLKQAGCIVFQGKANFLLVYSEQPLYDKLLERGILIRDCGNFRGLSKGFYRVAVKNRNENMTLLKEIGDIKWN